MKDSFFWFLGAGLAGIVISGLAALVFFGIPFYFLFAR